MGAKASLPYEIGEEYARNSVWKLHRGIVKANNQQVTIFVCNIKENTTDRVDYARNCLKRSKIVKHPSFVAYIECVTGPSFIFFLLIILIIFFAIAVVAKSMT